jgi:hypothetical protein
MNDLAGLKAPRDGRRRGGKAVVIPIRTGPGEAFPNATDISRRLRGITSASSSEAILDKIDELRFELRCVEDAILSLELLTARRFPKRSKQLKEQIIQGCF